VIEHAPLFAGMAITYEKFGGSNFRSREMSAAFDTLEKVKIWGKTYELTSVPFYLVPRILDVC